MTALPKQVEQQLKEVEEMEKAMQAPQPSEQTAEQQPPEPQAAPAEGTPSEAVTQPAEPAQENWQAKYQTLEGKYRNEVPRLHQQNKELSNQLAHLQAVVEELSKPKPVQQEDNPLITEQDESAFGSDLVDMVRRATKEALREAAKVHSKEVEALQSKISQLENALVSTSGSVQSMSFEQQLARAIPDFDSINSSPEWVSWLNEVDPYTGQPRRSFAEYQYNQGDVAEVKRIVDLFKSQSGQAQKQQEKQQRQKELERQVQPSRSVSSSPATSGARFYTEAEASHLFDRVRKLNAVGKYEEATSLEAELTNAYNQGRVRG